LCQTGRLPLNKTNLLSFHCLAPVVRAGCSRSGKDSLAKRLKTHPRQHEFLILVSVYSLPILVFPAKVMHLLAHGLLMQSGDYTQYKKAPTFAVG